MTFAQRLQTARKAVVAWLIPTVPAIIAVVQARYGLSAVAEVTALFTALGVYKATNVPAPVPQVVATEK